jgi:hypothetical protein
MVLGIQPTFIDEIPLPKIYYIDQNEFTDKLNEIHLPAKEKVAKYNK